jgi:hypothetical protein
VNAITNCLQNTADAGHARVLHLYNDDRFDDALNAYRALPAPSAPAEVAAGAVADGGAANPARLQSLWTIGTELERRMAGSGWQGSAAATGDFGPAADSWRMDAGRRWRSFLGKGLPLLIGALSVLVLALIGLKTQWSSNLVFGSGGIIDDVALFLWGVAAFVTGKTVSDFLTTMTSS